MTYLVHQGKVMNEKKTIEENNIGTETTIVMSLRLLGGTEKSELMDTLESEEREKKRNLDEVSEGKLTRPSEDALFLRKEKSTFSKDQKKRTKKRWKSFYRKSRIQSGTAPRDGLNHCENGDDRYKQISERITNMEKKILEMDEKYENRSDEPRRAHCRQESR